MNETITPTHAMVEAAHTAYLNAPRYRGIPGSRNLVRAALAAALNHPDAAGLFADADALRAAREQGWDEAVDWVEEDQDGPSGRTTNARNANPYCPAPALPTEDGAVIIPAEGHEFIEAGSTPGQTCHAREAVLEDGEWWAAWRADGFLTPTREPAHITPGTWQEARP